MRGLVCLVGFCALPLAADAQIFECVDEGGTKRFTNIAAEAKGCKALNILPMEPPPVPPAPPGTATPRTQRPGSVPPATSTNFPRVDRATQQARDNDRRRILEQELGVEQKLLDDARRELAADHAAGAQPTRIEAHRKRIRVHEENLASLRREISSLR
jgi:hypothetical protein